jgi:flagellar biogenesis protein FliO
MAKQNRKCENTIAPSLYAWSCFLIILFACGVFSSAAFAQTLVEAPVNSTNEAYQQTASPKVELPRSAEAAVPAAPVPAPAVEIPAPAPTVAASNTSATPASAPSSAEAAKIDEVRALLERSSENSAAVTPPAPKEEFSVFQSSVRVFASLLMVLAIIGLGMYIVKRGGRRTPLLSGSTLGVVLGRLYLEPRVRLHFVRTGGKVLVVGVTQNAIAAVAQFDADQFSQERSNNPANAPAEMSGFMEQLKESMRNVQKNPVETREEDTDVSALKRDIDRLQKYLEEGSRFPKRQ